MTKIDTQPICVAHIRNDGVTTYHLTGAAVFLIVDERTPHDRVCRWTLQTPRKAINALVGSSPIGSGKGARHLTVTRGVRRALDGKPHSQLVDEVSDAAPTSKKGTTVSRLMFNRKQDAHAHAASLRAQYGDRIVVSITECRPVTPAQQLSFADDWPVQMRPKRKHG